MLKLFTILLMSLTFTMSAEVVTAPKKTHKPTYHYTRPISISPEVWDMVKPYFLPSNAPIKQVLDTIFSHSRVLANNHNIKAAGFRRPYSRPWSHCTVSEHPALPGYLMKMYTDDQMDKVDYLAWIHRIEGARAIQASLNKHNWNLFFKVPNKWIYPLPVHPEAAPGSAAKHFVLVVEDMNIYHKEKNFSRWTGKHMDSMRADAIWTILQENGLNDSVYAFNIPFCKDGRQAFIDTEHHHNWPIHFEKTLPYLSSEMKAYWLKLMERGGPKK